MDLHAWITQQVDRVEALARQAADCTTARRWEAINSLIVAVPDQNTAGPEIIEAAFHTFDDALVHAAANDPDVVLRRCEADRRILARHQLDPNVTYEPACKGCGTYGDLDLSNVDNLNDCPELLDLAHAHGITPEALEGLDQHVAPERPAGRQIGTATIGLEVTYPITTSDVPAALRGPRWKSHH